MAGAGNKGLLCGVLGLLVLACGMLPTSAQAPDKYDGLVAWYRIDSLHRNHSDGEPVVEWPDSSGKGHRLVTRADGVRAVFQTRQLNFEPLVKIRAKTVFQVERPFELQDHTIFLVFETSLTARALFHDDREVRRGLILFDEQRYHRYVVENPEDSVYYCGEPTSPSGFSITVLGRGAGRLNCRVNGVDLSSGASFEPAIRVGGFFHVRSPSNPRGDADGLRVAEMIFYDRMLSEEEIAGVTTYLSSKYAIEVASPEPRPDTAEAAVPISREFLPSQDEAGVWLGTRSEANVNSSAIVIPWQTQIKVESPFRHEPGEETDSRLICTRDGTQVELYVLLPVRTRDRKTRVQLLILKNGEEYLDEYGDSGPIAGGSLEQVNIEFKTSLELNAGDFIEIVARGIGERGVVIVAPHSAALVVRSD